MKLVSKLTLALVIGMCLVLATYGYLSVGRERVLFESDMQRDERLMGRALSAAVAAVWRLDGEQRALKMLREAGGREGLRIRWVSLDPPPAATHDTAISEETAEALRNGIEIAHFERLPGRGGRLFTYAPTRIDAARAGAIEISESLDEEGSYIRASIVNTVLTTIALVAMSGMIAMGLGAWIVGRPVRTLAAKARRIGGGDLSGPLTFPQHDELSELAQEMNLMCDRLAEARSRIAHETTARIAALEQLRHADRLTTIGKLASGIAHELGTPLNVVAGRAKMIARGANIDQSAQSANVIVDQVERMTHIIRQLLDFARHRGPQKAPGDIADVARQTLSMLEPLAARSNVAFSIEGEAHAPSRFDAGQIQQVFTNLVMNGVQAMKSGGRLTVDVRRTHAEPPADHGGRDRDYVAVSVRDQGEGISTEDLDHVFEPFFTTKDVGDGTGLGLSVAYGIVREHGGWIEVDSIKNRGSTFTVYLPAGTA